MTEIEWRPRQPETIDEYVPHRIEGCVCGGIIVARGNPTQAVRLHQATPRHQEWWRLGGFDFDPELMGRQVP